MSLEYEDKMIKLKSNEKKKIKIHKKIVKTDEKIREIRREIANDTRRLNTSEKNEKWKQRTRKLIEMGVLLEIADILNEDKATLLGYFMKFQFLSKDEIKDCKIMGGEEFQMREEKKQMLKRRLEKKDEFR
ncbi:hypothetical protein JMUB3935_1335 [Leptotrichia trevisanii]|uniref:Conjugal transfer protein TraD n=1 Tax=Leptotrichia trevisanii TaxID=109328 RepID=A0A510KM38_9FUSO|nr:conjugal transfer protein TraD [Leptotrichia trevisanii]BBM52357.1 hypothetical protein JMUB3935_1335 [Leptotrichia trevisanii]